jgi:hypothetical protein
MKITIVRVFTVIDGFEVIDSQVFTVNNEERAFRRNGDPRLVGFESEFVVVRKRMIQPVVNFPNI